MEFLSTIMYKTILDDINAYYQELYKIFISKQICHSTKFVEGIDYWTININNFLYKRQP